MKGIIPLLVAFLILPSLASAETYFIRNDGTATQSNAALSNGGSCSSDSNAMSVNDHNSGSFSPGDTIYLCDTITSEVQVPSSGSAGNVITYRGDYAGHPGKISRQQEVDVSGIFIDGKSYITIHDLEIENCNVGIYSRESAHHITIKRCKIHDMLNQGIYFGYLATEYGGTGIGCNNVIVGGSQGDGNDIYNIGCGTAGTDVMILSTHDFVISYNHLYATPEMAQGLLTDRGIDGIVLEGGSYNGLIEYNEINGHNDDYWDDPRPGYDEDWNKGLGEDGIDIKEDNHDVVVRYNHIYDHKYQSGITMLFLKMPLISLKPCILTLGQRQVYGLLAEQVIRSKTIFSIKIDQMICITH